MYGLEHDTLVEPCTRLHGTHALIANADLQPPFLLKEDTGRKSHAMGYEPVAVPICSPHLSPGSMAGVSKSLLAAPQARVWSPMYRIGLLPVGTPLCGKISTSTPAACVLLGVHKEKLD